MNDVLSWVENGVGRLRLNRPAALNALTLGMIRELSAALTQWADDSSVMSVHIEGAGPRGLCAGADVRALREAALAGSDDAVQFLREEYLLNLLIATFPKPYRADMDGIVMGGGLGISAHGSRRYVGADTRAAMPETQIGLAPDVGMNWLLARAPGELGTHLALTGVTIGAADALAAGLADSTTAPLKPGIWPAHQVWIDECYRSSDPAEILGNLTEHAHPAAREAAALLATRCPLSVAAALEGLRRAAHLELKDVLDLDLRVCSRLVMMPDFAEGVRAQLVDKDRNPHWTHASLADVSRGEVEALFDPI